MIVNFTCYKLFILIIINISINPLCIIFKKYANYAGKIDFIIHLAKCFQIVSRQNEMLKTNRNK